MASYNYYYDLTSGILPSQAPQHHGSMSVNVVGPSTWPQQAGLPPSSAKQINSSQAEQCVDAYLKVVNPANKDHRQFMLRNLSRDLDCPEKLKASIFAQCGDIVPQPEDMELGYFNQTKKVWINNRLDVNDLWNLVARGDTLTLWCTGVSPSQSGRNSKRNREERDTGENVDHEPPKKMTRVEERKALADEYEAKLKELKAC